MSDTYDYDEVIEEKPSFDDALAALSEDHENLPGPVILYGLSGLDDHQIERLGPVWRRLDPSYRRVLMQMLVDVSESDFELNYDALGYANLRAPEPEIRQAAIELLWEDNSLHLMQQLMRMAQTDDAPSVRVEAIRALGRFILMGELGDLAEADTIAAQELLLGFINDAQETNDVQRHALESLANCSRADIAPLIANAYRSGRLTVRKSAIVAMGRTCDADAWADPVLSELESEDDEMRRAAVRAAGELQLEEAVPDVVRILATSERDEQEVAVWSLGEIGGKQAMKALEALAGNVDDDDEEFAALIDDAIGNASLINGDLMMLDFTEFDDN